MRITGIDRAAIVSENEPERHSQGGNKYSHLQPAGRVKISKTDILILSKSIAHITEKNRIQRASHRDDIFGVENERFLAAPDYSLIVTRPDGIDFVASDGPFSSEIKSLPERHFGTLDRLNKLIIDMKTDAVISDDWVIKGPLKLRLD